MPPDRERTTTRRDVLRRSALGLIGAAACGATPLPTSGAEPAPATAPATAGGGAYDVVVYGGVPGGIAAAVAAARNGARALLVEQTRHVGGLSTSGVNTSEIEHMLEPTYGGIALEFYQRLGTAYGFPGRPLYRWESHVAERVYLEMLEEAGVEVWFDKLVDRVEKQGTAIARLAFTDGTTARRPPAGRSSTPATRGT